MGVVAADKFNSETGNRVQADEGPKDMAIEFAPAEKDRQDNKKYKAVER